MNVTAARICQICNRLVEAEYSCTLMGCPGRKADGPKEKELAKDPSRGVLNERGSTHGDFGENGKIMQALKAEVRGHWGWEKLSLHQREALEMILHKIGRILCGDPNYFDHWRDIAGYAKLCEERCPEISPSHVKGDK